jgi:hypothetical protein
MTSGAATIAASPVDPELLARVERLVTATLLASWARRPTMWARAVVCLVPGKPAHVRLRDDLASELRENDLAELAHECKARRVGVGQILVWVLRDDDEAAFAGFEILRVRP